MSSARTSSAQVDDVRTPIAEAHSAIAEVHIAIDENARWLRKRMLLMFIPAWVGTWALFVAILVKW